MEYVNCDLCGANDYEVICRKARFNMDICNVICKKCGLIYINPRMDPQESREFYKKEYRILYNQIPEPTKEVIERNLEAGRKILDFASDWVKNAAEILEVGCATGGLLQVFKNERDGHVFGIEPSLKYSRYAREVFKLNVFTGTIEEFIAKSEKKGVYDFIILSHVLEHFSSPSEMLEEICTFLKENGKIYIEIPNIMNPYRKLSYFFEVAHLYNFSPVTIQLLLDKTGLQILKFDDYASYIMLVAQKTNKEKTLNYNGEEYKKVLRYLQRYRIYGRQVSLFRQWGRSILLRMLGREQGERVWEVLKEWRRKRGNKQRHYENRN